MFFCLLVYVLSSWWTWIYGGSYGSRVMIDYYSVIILFGSSFFMLKSTVLKGVFSMLLISFSYISIIQTYQYQNYILHWSEMNYDRYWQTFLKTDDKYKGLLWIQQHDTSNKTKVFTKKVIFNQAMGNDSHHIDSTQFNSLVPEYRLETNYLVALQMQVEYEKGDDEVALIIEDTLGQNKYFYSQQIFKGVGFEPYKGEGCLLFEIKGATFNYNKMKMIYFKKEEKSIIKEMEISIYEL